MFIYLAVQNVPLRRIESIFRMSRTGHCLTLKRFHSLLKVCKSTFAAIHGGTGKAFSHAKMYENIELIPEVATPLQLGNFSAVLLSLYYGISYRVIYIMFVCVWCVCVCMSACACACPYVCVRVCMYVCACV